MELTALDLEWQWEGEEPTGINACVVPVWRIEDPCERPTVLEEQGWQVDRTMDFFNTIYHLYAKLSENNYAWEKTYGRRTNNHGFPPGLRFHWPKPLRENRRWNRMVGRPNRPRGNLVVKSSPNANEYIKAIFIWAEEAILDQETFPSDPAIPFPDSVYVTLQKIWSRFGRILAIILSNETLLRNETAPQESHNLFKKFYYFGLYWSLATRQDMLDIVPEVNRIVAREYRVDSHRFLSDKK